MLRWQAFTGQEARLEGGDASFAGNCAGSEDDGACRRAGGPGMTQGVRFEPTDEQRRTVRAMAGYGVPLVDIAIFLDIDAKCSATIWMEARVNQYDAMTAQRCDDGWW